MGRANSFARALATRGRRQTDECRGNVERAVDDLAAYERYRAALKADAEGRANFDWAQALRFILREERTWLEDVGATRNVARQVTP